MNLAQGELVSGHGPLWWVGFLVVAAVLILALIGLWLFASLRKAPARASQQSGAPQPSHVSTLDSPQATFVTRSAKHTDGIDAS